MADQPQGRPPQNSYAQAPGGWDQNAQRESPIARRPAGWRPPRDPAQAALEATIVGSLNVADDEPTRLGQSLDTAGTVERAAAPKGAAAPAAQQRPPSEPPRAESAVRAGYVQVVATVVDPPPGTHNLPFIKDADSPVAASYRVLRHRLREANNPSTIAVTSPGRSEGKTTCAINLAMALAEHGREKVLLVEANLRFPHLAAALGFTAPSCFGRQMAAHLKSPLSPWEVVAAFFHNLHVLAVDTSSVGQWRMSAPGLKLAMDQLQASGYKHIIVDCPSALGSADVNVIEDTTDGVLLTARPGKTTAESLRKTERHLATANILGVVLT
ncbi:MAG TPA: CpsD/CapB family tyrosine-protein kinase [Polyangiaceae bacterium]|nr:CpsD/CapB family tyrosine-protein kinase [Polyangiaceae bacterium]